MLLHIKKGLFFNNYNELVTLSALQWEEQEVSLHYKGMKDQMADRMRFELTVRFHVHTLSKRAP